MPPRCWEAEVLVLPSLSWICSVRLRAMGKGSDEKLSQPETCRCGKDSVTENYLGNDTETLLKTKIIEEKAVPARVFLERFFYALRLALNGTGSILWASVLDRMKRRKQPNIQILLPASSLV